jgi:hypothetical protein
VSVVEIASTGAQAVRQAEGLEPDVVFVDRGLGEERASMWRGGFASDNPKAAPSAPPGRITPASNEAGRPRPTTAVTADRALGRSIEHVDRGRRVAGGVGPLRPHDPIVRQRVSAGRLVDIQHEASV